MGGKDGVFPKKGDSLKMHYTGTYYGGKNHGKTFDSSLNAPKPFQFTIGEGNVITGWDEGILQMTLGEKAVLEIGWNYGYGEEGYATIGPKQDLRFDVELLKIN